MATARNTGIAALIDHTLLKADSRRPQVMALCREAREYGFAAVCVHPVFVGLAAAELAGSPVKAGTVIGFPTGAVSGSVKAAEAAEAVENGAAELDMVLAIWALKDRRYDAVKSDIAGVVSAAQGCCVKVILETCLLTDDEKVVACGIAVEAGARFVKTSTGLAGGGATVADVRLMRETVGPQFGVKASGGIRTLDDARKMVEAGANRIGTSAGVAIVNENILSSG